MLEVGVNVSGAEIFGVGVGDEVFCVSIDADVGVCAEVFCVGVDVDIGIDADVR